MARSQNTVRGRARLARDSQQWMLDYLIQETGKVFHFQGEGVLGRLANSFKKAEADTHFSRNLFFRRGVAVALDQVAGDAG